MNRNAEAVMDEVALLEAQLRRHTDMQLSSAPRRGEGGHAPFPPVAPLAPFPQSSPQTSPAEQLPSNPAEARYALQLQTWVDYQVDARVHHVVQSFVEGELTYARQDAAAALGTCERLERELTGTNDAQAKLLDVVGGLSHEMARIKSSLEGMVNRKEEEATRELKQLRALRSNDERQLTELRAQLHDNSAEASAMSVAVAAAESAGQRRRAEQEIDARQRSESLAKRLELWKHELTSELNQEVRSCVDTARQFLEGRVRQLEERLQTSTETFRLEHERFACFKADLELRLEKNQQDLKAGQTSGHVGFSEAAEELKRQAHESQIKFSEELTALQQKLVGELRAEMAAAFRSEAATVAALDEQIWLTDQRLGQRIDELAHLHLRDRVATVERRCKEASTVLSNNPGGVLISPGDDANGNEGYDKAGASKEPSIEERVADFWHKNGGATTRSSLTRPTSNGIEREPAGQAVKDNASQDSESTFGGLGGIGAGPRGPFRSRMTNAGGTVSPNDAAARPHANQAGSHQQSLQTSIKSRSLAASDGVDVDVDSQRTSFVRRSTGGLAMARQAAVTLASSV